MTINMNMTMNIDTQPDDLLAVDAANREAALDTQKSFLIEAPAGAGKTELLTQRFLALLTTVNDPEEIIALTFTNKAAAEMRHRVVSSLQTAASGKPPTEPHKAKTYELGLEVLRRDVDRQWNLLQHVGRLQITTLDALCAKLARQMPLLARLGSQPGIALDADPYYAEAAEATLQALDEGHVQADAIERVLDYFDNDAGRFASMLADMLKSRDQWLRHSRAEVDLDAAERALATLIGDVLQGLAQAFPAGLQERLMPAARFAASNLLTAQTAGSISAEWVPVMRLTDWQQALTADPQDLPQWRGLAALLLTKGNELRSRLPPDFGFGTPAGKPLGAALKAIIEDDLSAEAGDALAEVRQLPSPNYSDEERQLIADLVTVLKVGFAQLWLAFKRAGEVDFTEMAQNALLALGDDEEPSDLQLSLDYRISHLLVDEFQDTSPTQVELLRKLTRGWQPEDGRTLFLVGDPMQSIYRFRKADVGLFLKVKGAGLGSIRLQALKLYRNNRSHAEIVEWGNRVFPAVFADEDNFHRGAVRFAEAKATKGSHPLAGISWHPIIDAQGSETDADDEDLDPADEREAKAVIDIIGQARQADPTGTIAILVRARTHLKVLVKALRACQPALPFQAVEIEALADRQVIQDLLSLTQALLHQGDRIHWLALLRAPWCGLTLDDLHALAGDDHYATLWSLIQNPSRCQKLSADGQARLAHVREVLQEAYTHQGRQRLRRWVEGVWQNLGGAHCLQGPGDLLDCQAFFNTLDTLDEQGALSLARLQAEVGDLYAAPDPTASAQLQIMTMHKSKGLEFDTVILPGLHKKPQATDKKLLLWDEFMDANGHEQLVLASVSNGQASASEAPPKFTLLHRFESERNRNETQRLLYVAVTRAKRHLHLVGCAKMDSKSKDSVLKKPASDSLLALLWHEGRAPFEAACLVLPAPVRSADADAGAGAGADEGSGSALAGKLATPWLAEDFNHKLVRLQAPQRPGLLRPLGVNTQEPPAPPELAPGDDPQAASGGELAADVGTLVHKYLEMMARDGLDRWQVERVRSLGGPMQCWLRQQGHSQTTAAAAARESVDHLVTTLESDMGRWILGPHEAAACEVPFTTVRDGVTQNHIIDRTFVDNGVQWIVDYKTTRLAADEGVNELYQQQLARYRTLYPANTQCKCLVFFTRTGKAQEFADRLAEAGE